MGDLRTWRMGFDSLVPDKKTNIDPPGYDATIAKEPVRSSDIVEIVFSLQIQLQTNL